MKLEEKEEREERRQGQGWKKEGGAKKKARGRLFRSGKKEAEFNWFLLEAFLKLRDSYLNSLLSRAEMSSSVAVRSSLFLSFFLSFLFRFPSFLPSFSSFSSPSSIPLPATQHSFFFNSFISFPLLFYLSFFFHFRFSSCRKKYGNLLCF